MKKVYIVDVTTRCNDHQCRTSEHGTSFFFDDLGDVNEFIAALSKVSNYVRGSILECEEVIEDGKTEYAILRRGEIKSLPL